MASPVLRLAVHATPTFEVTHAEMAPMSGRIHAVGRDSFCLTKTWTRMDEDDIDPSDDPIYRAGVLMGRNQALTDVMERLFSPDAMSPDKTVRSLHAWVRQTMEEVRVEMQLVFADLCTDDEDDDQDGDA